MPTFSPTAVEIKQGNLKVYLAYVTPNDLFNTEKFYEVDKLEPQTQAGFQRILDESRVQKLARHLTDAYPEGYAHLPTTVFLATDQSVSYNETTCMLEFDTGTVCPFSVVDGQHRIEGLRRAFYDNPAQFIDFRLPVAIATELNDIHQMYHFFIVNTTQVAVDRSLQQQITKRFTDMQGVAHLPYFPHWLRGRIQVGKDKTAIDIVTYLNQQTSSPLCGRIQMANEVGQGYQIKQSTIVNLFKSEVLTPAHPMMAYETDPGKQARMFLNYFIAIDNLFVAGNDWEKTVAYRSNGLFFFLNISKWVFNVIYSSTKDFTVGSMTKIIEAGLNELDAEYRALSSPDWWLPGGANLLSRGAFRQYIDAFQRALTQSQQSGDIRL